MRTVSIELTDELVDALDNCVYSNRNSYPCSEEDRDILANALVAAYLIEKRVWLKTADDK